MADDRLLGDLRERADGGFDGWCWAPGRADQRMVVDLLVDDVLAVSMVAAIFRRDLLTQGYGDGRHGFALRLPAHLSGAVGEQLITARERRSGAVFGRVLRKPHAALPIGGERLRRVDQDTEAVWQRLAAARAALGRPLPSQLLRGALAELAGQLSLRAAGHRADAPHGLLPWRDAGMPGRPVVLPDPLAPAFSIVLLCHDAAATLRRVVALAPALPDIDADVTVIDPGHDPAGARLPERLRNLRYRRAPHGSGLAGALALAREQAAGRWLLLLDAQVAEPSAAALLAFARATADATPALWLGSEATDAVAQVGDPPRTAVRLPARLGIAVCVARGLLDDLGPPDAALADGAGLEWADLAFKARLLGAAVLGVEEPLPAGPAAATAARPPTSAASPRQARATFRARWGAVAANMLDRVGGAA